MRDGGHGGIDFSRSRAILLGTSAYTQGFGKVPMPAAANGVAAMRAALTGPSGWHDARITPFMDQNSHDSVLSRIAALVHEAEDVLLFYYVGHGQLLSGNDLGLALTDTSEDPRLRLSTSLRLSALREEIENNCDARIKILILDCCVSGIATKYAQGPGDLAARVHQSAELIGEGTYTWTACGHSQETYFEPGPHGLTYFTRFLTSTLHQGIDGGNASLAISDIHQEVKRRLRQTDIPDVTIKPEPTLRFAGSVDRFYFAPNAAWIPARAKTYGAPRPVGEERDSWLMPDPPDSVHEMEPPRLAPNADADRFVALPGRGARRGDRASAGPEPVRSGVGQQMAGVHTRRETALVGRVLPRQKEPDDHGGPVVAFLGMFILVAWLTLFDTYLLQDQPAHTSVGLVGAVRLVWFAIGSRSGGAVQPNPLICGVVGLVGGLTAGLALSPLLSFGGRAVNAGRIVVVDVIVSVCFIASVVAGGAVRLGVYSVLIAVGYPLMPILGTAAILSLVVILMSLYEGATFDELNSMFAGPAGRAAGVYRIVAGAAAGAARGEMRVLSAGAIGGLIAVGMWAFAGGIGVTTGLGALSGVSLWLAGATGAIDVCGSRIAKAIRSLRPSDGRA